MDVIGEVCSRFQTLGGPKRVELMCNLVRMCLPLELRFLGTCVEDIAKKDFFYLRQDEIRANDLSELNTLSNVFNPTTRCKLNIYLSLLNSSNTPCSGVLFNTLTSFNLAHSNCELTTQLLDELQLLLTLAANHPAFTFNQRQILIERLNLVRKKIEEKQPRNEYQILSSNGPSAQSVASHQTKPVHVKAVQVLGATLRVTDRKHEFHMQVLWTDGDTTDIYPTYQDLYNFHQDLLKLVHKESTPHRTVIPSFPQDKTSTGPSHIKEQMKMYMSKLCDMPAYILDSSHINNFLRGPANQKSAEARLRPPGAPRGSHYSPYRPSTSTSLEVSPLCSPVNSPLASPHRSPAVSPRSGIQRASCPRPPEKMSLQQWLKINRLHKYESQLSKFTVDELLSLSDKDLEAEGLTVGARKKLRLQIEATLSGMNGVGSSIAGSDCGGSRPMSPSSPPQWNTHYLRPELMQGLFASGSNSLASTPASSEFSSPPGSPGPEPRNQGDRVDAINSDYSTDNDNTEGDDLGLTLRPGDSILSWSPGNSPNDSSVHTAIQYRGGGEWHTQHIELPGSERTDLNPSYDLEGGVCDSLRSLDTQNMHNKKVEPVRKSDNSKESLSGASVPWRVSNVPPGTPIHGPPPGVSIPSMFQHPVAHPPAEPQSRREAEQSIPARKQSAGDIASTVPVSAPVADASPPSDLLPLDAGPPPPSQPAINAYMQAARFPHMYQLIPHPYIFPRHPMMLPPRACPPVQPIQCCMPNPAHCCPPNTAALQQQTTSYSYCRTPPAMATPPAVLTPPAPCTPPPPSRCTPPPCCNTTQNTEPDIQLAAQTRTLDTPPLSAQSGSPSVNATNISAVTTTCAGPSVPTPSVSPITFMTCSMISSTTSITASPLRPAYLGLDDACSMSPSTQSSPETIAGNNAEDVADEGMRASVTSGLSDNNVSSSSPNSTVPNQKDEEVITDIRPVRIDSPLTSNSPESTANTPTHSDNSPESTANTPTHSDSVVPGSIPGGLSIVAPTVPTSIIASAQPSNTSPHLTTAPPIVSAPPISSVPPTQVIAPIPITTVVHGYQTPPPSGYHTPPAMQAVPSGYHTPPAMQAVQTPMYPTVNIAAAVLANASLVSSAPGTPTSTPGTPVCSAPGCSTPPPRCSVAPGCSSCGCMCTVTGRPRAGSGQLQAQPQYYPWPLNVMHYAPPLGMMPTSNGLINPSLAAGMPYALHPNPGNGSNVQGPQAGSMPNGFSPELYYGAAPIQGAPSHYPLMAGPGLLAFRMPSAGNVAPVTVSGSGGQPTQQPCIVSNGPGSSNSSTSSHTSHTTCKQASRDTMCCNCGGSDHCLAECMDPPVDAVGQYQLKMGPEPE